MGMGATNKLERVAATMGLVHGVELEFQHCVDVVNGAVLFALPALLAWGLLHHTDTYFSLPQGYYRLDSLFLLLAFMALAQFHSNSIPRHRTPLGL